MRIIISCLKCHCGIRRQGKQWNSLGLGWQEIQVEVLLVLVSSQVQADISVGSSVDSLMQGRELEHLTLCFIAGGRISGALADVLKDDVIGWLVAAAGELLAASGSC